MENFDTRQSLIDEEHLRLLSLFHYIKGGLTIAMALLGMAYFLFIGFMFRMGNISRYQAADFTDEFSINFFSWFMLIGGIIMLLVLIFGILQLVSAYYIRRKQYRLFSFILGILQCIEIPYGTVLGVVTIIVLTRGSVMEKYRNTEMV
jgi:hypothetical protein